MPSLDRNPSWLLLTTGLLCHLFSIALFAEPDPDPVADLGMPSLWVKSFEARVWAGYKDNILLANRNEVSGPLLAGAFDATLFRLPVNEWEYLFLTSAEYVWYPDSPQVNQEATAIVEGQAQKSFGDGWKSSLTADYLYFNQVFDGSVFEDVFQAVQVEGHTFIIHPAISKQFGKGYRLELEVPGSRQLFDSVIDNYWEIDPKLTLKREFSRNTEVAVYYQFGERWHDTRLERNVLGEIEPGHLLRFDIHELGATWRQFWGGQRYWRTLTRLSVQRNEDNGGGYYDYVRPQLSEQLRFQAHGWDARAEARLSYYHYDYQRVTDASSDIREKAYLRLSLRADKLIRKSLKVFAQFEHERAFSNVSLDRYEANTFSLGLDWEF